MLQFNRTLRVESLEQRNLLSADFGIKAIEHYDVRELAAIYAPESAASSLATEFANERWVLLRKVDKSTFDPATTGYQITNGAITVSVMGTVPSDELLKVVTNVGLTPTFVSPIFSVVDGSIQLADLHRLIETDVVLAVVPYMPESATDSVGSVNNDAEIALRGQTIRNFLEVTGSGVSIGVISNGVGGAADSQATNDLPPNVGTPGANVTLNILNAGTGNEGTAMLELIHDIAPGANLLFHGAGIGEATFANAVNNLVAAGADIIVDDINGLTTESWFADGAAAAAITNAMNAGVFYVSSAGNRGDNAFEAPSNFVVNQNVFGNVGTFHDFDGAGDFLQTVTITADAQFQDFQLQFDQLFGNVNSDLRLWLFDIAGNVITSSNEANIALNNPNDFLFITGAGIAQLAIELVAGPAPQRLRWTHWGDVGAIEHDTVAGNLRTGRNPGHAATINNVSVGAVGNNFPNATNVTQPLVRQAYSGIGEVTRTRDVTGNPLPAVEFRGGPTLMGVDGTMTSVDNLDAMGNPVAGWNNFTVFHGTSAAAPNVAAIAALLLETDPLLTPHGIRNALTRSAFDMDAMGVDLTSGAGLVDGLGGLGILQDTPQLVRLQNNQYILVNVTNDALDTNPDPNIIDVSPAAGNQVSLRAAIVNANLATSTQKTILLPAGNYQLSLTGIGGDTQGDLDITNTVTIVGAGAGRSVVNATGLGDRIFEVVGAGRSLTLADLTLRGGSVGGFGGGAIYVDGGASVNVNRIAVVGNTTTAVGGGIYSSGVGTSLTVRNSVFTGNVATLAGGAIAVIPGNVNTFTFGNNIFAKNSGNNNFRNIYYSHSILDYDHFKNEGNNVADSNTGNVFTTTVGDLIDTTTLAADLHVVTNVADVIDAADGTAGLSLREAVIAANAGNDTIWLPAWKHFLTRQSAVAETTQDATIGDLDITGVVTLIGAGAGLSPSCTPAD